MPRERPAGSFCFLRLGVKENCVDPNVPSEKELQTLLKICEIWEKLGKDYRQTLQAWQPVNPDRLVWKQRMLNGLDMIGK